jgi:NAD kinase
MEKFLVVFKEEECAKHTAAVEAVYKVLDAKSVSYVAKCRTKLSAKDFKNIDLVVVIGGDGTFLKTSHYCGEVPLLGVNSDPKTTEGFFMRCDGKSFSRCFERILKDDFKQTSLIRLQGSVNGKDVAPCLNEYFIGPHKPYGVAHYTLSALGKKEDQKSSGVLIGTAAGSFAWLKSAGGVEMDLSSEDIQFIVREAYHGRLSSPTLLEGISPRDISIVVHSDMLLVGDSVSDEILLREGDVVTVTVSNEKLWLVEFP